MNVDTRFEVSEADTDGVSVITACGEVDVASAPQLHESLLAAAEHTKRVAVVDLTDVSFVDSTALGVLVSAAKRFRSSGGDLRLVVAVSHITKVLEITGLTDVFAIYGSLDEAVGA